ncbi:MAG: hypothetical protein JWP36_2104 [Paucimonas sp.]|nr:hypothetical protein [Paucimonas sp.]
MSGSSPGLSQYEFSLDSVRAGVATGWVRDPRSLSRQLAVTLVIDGQAFTDIANIRRPDALLPGREQADCGFAIHFGLPQFSSLAFFVDGQCVFSEHAAPAQVPGPPSDLDGAGLANLAALACDRRERALFIFAISPWHPRAGRHRQLAQAMAARGWDIFYIEPSQRGAPGIRVEQVENERIFLLNLPTLALAMPSPEERLPAAAFTHWRGLLAPLVATYSSVASLWCGPQWWDMMRCSPEVGPRIFDYHQDFSRPAPDRVTPKRILQGMATADAVSFTSASLPVLAQARELGKRCSQVRNGYAEPIGQFAGPAQQRPYIFGAATSLARRDGVRWMRDFLLANPALPAVLAGSGDLQPMFEDLARTQPCLSYVGEVPHLLASFCMARSRFALFAAADAASARRRNPINFYEAVALGVPVLGPFCPDVEEALHACFTPVPGGRVSLELLTQADASFRQAVTGLDLATFTWAARAAQLDALIILVQQPQATALTA